MQPVWSRMVIGLLAMILILGALAAIVLVLTLRRRKVQRGFDVLPSPPPDEQNRQ